MRGSPSFSNGPTSDDVMPRVTRLTVYLILAVLPVAISTITGNANQIKSLIYNVLILGLFLYWVHRTVNLEGFNVRRTPLYRPMALYVLWIIICALLSGYMYATVPEVIRTLACICLCLAVINYVTERRQLDTLLFIVMLASVIPCVYGVLQHFRIDPIAWVPSSHERILATFGNPTYFAAYLAFTIPVTLSRLLTARSSASIWGYGALLGIQQLCLIWTFSRGPWLGAAFALALMLVLMGMHNKFGYIRRLWKPLILAVALLVIATIVGSSKSQVVLRAASSLNKQDPSNVQRSLQWKAGLGVFLDHPIKGVGPGALKIHISRKLTPAFYRTGIETVSEHAHNEFIEIAAESGVIGLLLFLWVAATGFSMARQVQCTGSRSETDDWASAHSAGLFAGIMGLLVSSMGGVATRYSVGSIYLWLYLGLIASIHLLPSARHKEVLKSNQDSSDADYVRISIPRIPVSAVKFRRFLVLTAMVLMWVTARPFAADLQAERVDDCIAQGNAEQAEEAIAEYLALSPHDVSMMYRLASLQCDTGRLDVALDTYKRLQKLSPDYARVHYNLGSVYLNMGRSTDAARELEIAAHYDGLPSSWEALSKAYVVLGKPKKAAEARARSLENEKDEGYWTERVDLAEQYIELQRYQSAREILEGVLQERQGEYRLHFDLALVCEKLGDLSEAETQYKLAVTARPDDPKVSTNLGALYYKQGKYLQAKGYFEHAASKSVGVETVCNLGMVYWKLGNNKRALQECEKVLNSSPDSAAADRARAIIYRITGEKRP